MTIGDIIRKKRIEAGLSQEELAIKLGKSKNVISNWERGDNKPDVTMIELLCGILNVTPNYLMGWPEEKAVEDEIDTIAAHHEGDWTEEELAEIEKFKEFVKAKRSR